MVDRSSTTVSTTKKRRARRKTEKIGSEPFFVCFVSSRFVPLFAVPIQFANNLFNWPDITILIVTVLYELKPAHAESFKLAILKNSASSLRDEPGCHQFDVSLSDDGLRCFLYEVYDDNDAFAAHRASPHFEQYDRTVK